MDMRGHNSAAFGETLAEVETVLGDDHETVFHYVQWHIGDYIAGTDGMVLEIEGAYMRFLSRLYRRGKPLPDDDLLMASTMGLTTRVWRRVKQVLIGFGKIIARNGSLTNARFEREREARAAEIKKRSAAATARWEKSAKKAAGLVVATPIQRECNADTTRMQSQSDAKKTNKNNDPSVEVHMLTNNQYPITIKETPPPPSRMPPPMGGTKRDPFGLNPTNRRIREDVWFDQDHRIQVGNGFKAELLALTGGEQRLRIELDRAAEWIGPNTPEIVLLSKVRGRVQSQMAEKQDKDERYQRAVRASKSPDEPKKPASRPRPWG
jgi:uncharacterized protein YdaU (DUF1376 family)